MNVWFVNHFAVPPTQAGGTRHYALARALQAHGIHVTLIISSVNNLTRAEQAQSEKVYRLEEIEGVPFMVLQSTSYDRKTSSRLRNMLSFAWHVARGGWTDEMPRPDVVVGSTPSLFAALAAWRLARKWRVPFVLEVRDIWPQTLIDLGNYSPTHPGVKVLGRIESFLYRAADHIVTLLPFADRHIAMRGGEREKVTWVPNGVDLAATAPPSTQPVRDRSAPFRVVYAGAHGLANALDAVLDAAALLQARHGDRFTFIFYGDGHEKPRLQQRAQTEGLHNVRFEAPVPKREVPRYLGEADALIVNMNSGNLYRFGISFNKLYDYLAAGRPIVFGADSANNPVEEAEAGLSVAANDAAAMAEALERLAALPDEAREQMGRCGRAFVEEHHDASKLALRLADVLRKVTA